MSRPKQFPTEIFISHEGEDTTEPWKQVYETAEDAAVLGEKKRVGRYLLAEIQQVEGIAKVVGSSAHCHPNFRRK
jgi:hypothetical protein